MPFEVKVKLLKEMYHVQVDPEESPSKFAEAVEAECGVPPGKKLIIQTKNDSIKSLEAV